MAALKYFGNKLCYILMLGIYIFLINCGGGDEELYKGREEYYYRSSENTKAGTEESEGGTQATNISESSEFSEESTITISSGEETEKTQKTEQSEETEVTSSTEISEVSEGTEIFPACPEVDDPDNGNVDDTDFIGGTIPLENGWYRGKEVLYWNLGKTPNHVSYIYLLVWESGEKKGTPVAGQYPIVDTIPGQSNYSPFWEIVTVQVPTNYKPNSIKSLSTLLKCKYPLASKGRAINSPIVKANTKLEGDEPQRKLTLGWYRNKKVNFLPFSGGTLSVKDGKLPSEPIWIFLPEGSETYVGSPVIDYKPPTEGETPIWSPHIVNVRMYYEEGEIRNAVDIDDSQTIKESYFLNYPIKSISTDTIPPQNVDDTIFIHKIPIKDGYYKGRLVKYWDIGESSNNIIPLYVLYREGEDAPIEGNNIIDSVPGDKFYSHFLQVIKVEVPKTYDTDTVRSFPAIQKNQFKLISTEKYLDCPVVSPDVIVEEPKNISIFKGWYKGSHVTYLCFDNINLPVSNLTVKSSKAWVFIPEEKPNTAQNILGGNVIDTTPQDPDYSPLWKPQILKVRKDYLPGEIRNSLDIDEEQTIEAPFYLHFIVSSISEEILPPRNVNDTNFIHYLPTETGYYQEAELDYWNIGLVNPNPLPMYVLYRNNKELIGSSVIDDVPGDKNNTPFKKIYRIDVPTDYDINNLRSFAAIKKSGLPLTDLNIFMNYPVVANDIKIAGNAGGAVTVKNGWYRGSKVTYLAFSDIKELPAEGDILKSNPIYILYYESSNEPISGNNVVDVIPVDEFYTPLWQIYKVIVPSTYIKGTLRSFEDIKKSRYPIIPTNPPLFIDGPVKEIRYTFLNPIIFDNKY